MSQHCIDVIAYASSAVIICGLLAKLILTFGGRR